MNEVRNFEKLISLLESFDFIFSTVVSWQAGGEKVFFEKSCTKLILEV